MNNKLDLSRLSRAIEDAIAAVPVAGCQQHSDLQVRRACQEMALYLIHLKEMSARLARLTADNAQDTQSTESTESAERR